MNFYFNQIGLKGYIIIIFLINFKFFLLKFHSIKYKINIILKKKNITYINNFNILSLAFSKIN